MIKNIVFDMGNVLIEWSPAVLLERLGLPEADRVLLLRELFLCAEWQSLDRGTITTDEAMALMAYRIPERLHGAAMRIMNDWWKDPLTPMPGIAELIAELDGLGYGIYLLSNATSRVHDYFDRIPGSQYFRGKLISADVKLLKPQHEIYEALFETFGLRPEECYFVDDNAANIEAAGLLGMHCSVFFADVNRLRAELRRAGVPVKTDVPIVPTALV